MSNSRPSSGSNDAFSSSRDDLARLLALRVAETDRQLAASLSSRVDQMRYQEGLAGRMAEATEIYELGRLLLRELSTTLGASHAVLAVVAESQFLEVIASTQAITPPYQLELLEECFVAGERLEFGAAFDFDFAVPGATELPQGVDVLAVPLFTVDGSPVGALVIEGTVRRDHLEAFLALASVGLADCRVYGRIDQLITDAVIAISNAHAARSEGPAPIQGRHIHHVEQLALQLARGLGLSPTQTRRVRLTALLHDMAPADIAEAFLNIRRGKHTAAQWQAWMELPFKGGIYGSPLAAFQKLVNELGYLRCRWDGKGNALPACGDEIPLASRVVAVAEAFENLTGRREHRTTLSYPGALDQLRRLAGAQYDPAVVDALCRQFAALEIEARVGQLPKAN